MKLGPSTCAKPSNYHDAVMQEWSQGFCKPAKTGASTCFGFIQLYAASPQADCRITGDPEDPLSLTETPHLLNLQCWCLLITRVSTPTSESFPGEGKHDPPSFLTNTLLFPVEYNIWNHSDLHSPHSLSVCLDFPLCYIGMVLHCQNSQMSLLLFYELRSWTAEGLCTVKHYRSSCAEQSLIRHLFP